LSLNLLETLVLASFSSFGQHETEIFLWLDKFLRQHHTFIHTWNWIFLYWKHDFGDQEKLTRWEESNIFCNENMTKQYECVVQLLQDVRLGNWIFNWQLIWQYFYGDLKILHMPCIDIIWMVFMQLSRIRIDIDFLSFSFICRTRDLN